MASTIAGRISTVIHQSDGFNVFLLQVVGADAPKSKVSVVGPFFGIRGLRPGVPLRCVGEWQKHKKYGQQFSARNWEPWAETDLDVELFLRECVEGFEDSRLARLVACHFHADAFEALTLNPDKVRELAVSEAEAVSLGKAVAGWGLTQALKRLSSLFDDWNLSPRFLTAVLAHLGIDAASELVRNPYRLVAVPGFGFDRADHLATKLGIPQGDPRRSEGAVLWALKVEAQSGHLFVRRADVPRAFRQSVDTDAIESLGGVLETNLALAAERLVERRGIVLDPEAGIYLPDLYQYERVAAERLARFMAPSTLDIELEGFLADYEKSNAIELSTAQREAVHKLIDHRVLVLTGLPGTGKTTLIRAIVQLFRRARIFHVLMAPTGIAAKRLASVSETDAATIHRQFKYDGTKWGYHASRKFAIGAVIVDEMSMVDQELFYRLLDALHPDTMLVLVGDDAQLPPVGPGNVLRELIGCPKIPHVRLTEIFRQAKTSEIVLASHRVNHGETPLVGVRELESEFQFVAMEDEEKIIDLVVEMAARLKAKDANFQVLSPKYEGVVGVNALNERLRERLNPAGNHREWRSGALQVREGDRLMVVQNNYQLNVYNGDMCKLTAVDKDTLRVRIHGIGPGAPEVQVLIPKKMAEDLLKLAYAVTVHKSQGSEFDTIIMPIVRSQGRMLQRNLLYTAITRARKKVWLLGTSLAIQKAVENDVVVQRNTVFGRVISDLLSV